MIYNQDNKINIISTNSKTYIKEILINKLDSINTYSDFIKITDNIDVKNILHKIIIEEKEHYGLFLKTLQEIDKEQEEINYEVNSSLHLIQKGTYKDYSIGKENRNLLLVNLRNAIKGELEILILYEALLDNIDNKKIASIIEKVSKDEKRHVEELTRALITLDEDSYGQIK